MNDPIFTIPKKHTRGSQQNKDDKAQRRLPRPVKIIGGKAIARLVNFSQQRERREESDKRKQPTVAPNRSLIVSKGKKTAAKSKTGNASAPSLRAAFAHKEAHITVPPGTVQRVWRPLGPFCIPHGQTYGAGPGSRPSISGRVSAISIDPNDPNHLLIGSGGGGGIWETRNNGTTWTPRSDDQPSLSIGAIAFSLSDSSVVYAGTGEGDGTLVDDENLLGVGLLKSSNGGESWSLIAKPFERLGFYELAVDPLDSNHVHAATTAGLFRSTDGGVTWKKKHSQRTWDLSIQPLLAGVPDSSKEIFAACSDGLFRSTNNGSSWKKVELPGGRKHYERLEVCHAPSDSNVVYVFAATPNPRDPNESPIPHLWRRNVFGGPFERVPKLPADLDTEQSWYDWFAGVAPNNPDVLYIGAINAHKGVRLASGDWKWENISAKNFGTSIHPDMHVIAFNPGAPNTIYIGCDGGIFRSPNGGRDWVSLNKGLCLTEVEFLAQHPQFESWLIAGTQDNGTLQYQGNDLWYHISDGDGGDCAVSSTFPYTCYVTFYGMGVARSTTGGGWNTWPPPPDDLVGPPVTAQEDYPDGALFYAPLEVNGRTVAQAGKKVFISTDAGDSWVRVALFLETEELASALSIPEPGRIFVGTTEGRIIRLDLSNGKWTRTPLARPMIGYASDILVDPANANRIFVTFQSSESSSHVFRSENAGSSWNDVSEGLPDIAVNAIEIDPTNPNTIFVAADVGVYRSDDAGDSWTLFNPGLPNVLVKDLAFHQPSRLLRAGTQARGVWEIPVDESTLPAVQIYLRDNSVDTGRLSPSPFGVDDPFNFGAQTFWWQCVDIKVDSSTLHTPALDEVDFEIFGDDQSMIGISDDDRDIQFAAGLLPENPIAGQVVRVYVRVNNRGTNPAMNVVVKMFFAPITTISFPDLPANFWLNFPNNLVPADSPWQPIASHKVIASVAAGSSQIVGFEWAVPATMPNCVALLSVISSDNDMLSTNELNIPRLITSNRKCGLRNVKVVNPSPANSPVLRSIQLDVTARDRQRCSVVVTQTKPSLIRAVVLSKPLGKFANKKLKQVSLTADDKVELGRLLESSPAVRKELNLKTTYAVPEGALIDKFLLASEERQPIVFLFNAKTETGVASVLQVAEDGTVLGGVTFQAVGLA